MKQATRILVTGAGGFIGHHLVKRLRADGHWVRGVDIKLPEYEASDAHEFELLDLRKYDNCLVAIRGRIDAVYNLAADMGGIGFITANHADIARNNVLINVHMLEASRVQGVARFLFSSSACIYPQSKQSDADVTPLCEEDAFPADPSRAMAGKSFIPRCSAVISVRTTRSIPKSSASTMCMVRLGRMKVGARKRQPRSAGRLRLLRTVERSKYGAMESRPGPLCTSTIVSRACCA